MRLTIYTCALSLLTLLFACQPTEEISPVAASSVDQCSHIGKVVENDCGIYFAMDNGHKIYVADSKEFQFEVGTQVKMGYYRTTPPSMTSTSSTCASECGCGQDHNDSSAASQANERESCMYDQGISYARVICVEIHNELD